VTATEAEQLRHEWEQRVECAGSGRPPAPRRARRPQGGPPAVDLEAVARARRAVRLAAEEDGYAAGLGGRSRWGHAGAAPFGEAWLDGWRRGRAERSASVGARARLTG
jgi:hypothetical protein